MKITSEEFRNAKDLYLSGDKELSRLIIKGFQLDFTCFRKDLHREVRENNKICKEIREEAKQILLFAVETVVKSLGYNATISYDDKVFNYAKLTISLSYYHKIFYDFRVSENNLVLQTYSLRSDAVPFERQNNDTKREIMNLNQFLYDDFENNGVLIQEINKILAQCNKETSAFPEGSTKQIYSDLAKEIFNLEVGKKTLDVHGRRLKPMSDGMVTLYYNQTKAGGHHPSKIEIFGKTSKGYYVEMQRNEIYHKSFMLYPYGGHEYRNPSNVKNLWIHRVKLNKRQHWLSFEELENLVAEGHYGTSSFLRTMNQKFDTNLYESFGK